LFDRRRRADHGDCARGAGGIEQVRGEHVPRRARAVRDHPRAARRDADRRNLRDRCRWDPQREGAGREERARDVRPAAAPRRADRSERRRRDDEAPAIARGDVVMGAATLNQWKEWVQTVQRKNYYEILRLKLDSTDAQIKAAFHTFALRFHPDSLVEEGPEIAALAAEIFKRGVEAYNILTKPELRKRYDEGLRKGRIRLDPNS